MDDTLVMSVSFGQEQIQIQYAEIQNQSPNGTIEESLTMNLDEKTERLVDEIREALAEIIDDYKISLRNPPEVVKGNRFLGDDDDDD